MLRNTWVRLAIDILVIAVLAWASARLLSILHMLSDNMQVHDSIPLFLEKVYGNSRTPSDDNKILVPTLIVGLGAVFHWSITFSWEIVRFLTTFLAGIAIYRLVIGWCARGHAILLVALTYFGALLTYSTGIRDHPTDFPDIIFVAVILGWVLNFRGPRRWIGASVLMIAFGFNRALAPFLGVVLGLALVIETARARPFLRELRRPLHVLLGLAAMVICGYIAQLNAKTIATRVQGGTYLSRIHSYLEADRYFVKEMWEERRRLDRESLKAWGGQIADRGSKTDDPMAEIQELQRQMLLPSSLEQKQDWLRKLTPYPNGLTCLILLSLVGALLLVSLSNESRAGAKWLGAALVGILLTNYLGGYLDEGRQSLWVLPFVALGMAEQISGKTKSLL